MPSADSGRCKPFFRHFWHVVVADAFWGPSPGTERYLFINVIITSYRSGCCSAGFEVFLRQESQVRSSSAVNNNDSRGIVG